MTWGVPFEVLVDILNPALHFRLIHLLVGPDRCLGEIVHMLECFLQIVAQLLLGCLRLLSPRSLLVSGATSLPSHRSLHVITKAMTAP